MVYEHDDFNNYPEDPDNPGVVYLILAALFTVAFVFAAYYLSKY